MEVATLGVPHLGSERQLKHLLEDYWAGRISAEDLTQGATRLEEEAWQLQANAGIDYIGVGDFALYDWVLNWIEYLGCTPPRFLQPPFAGLGPLERQFLMARGSCGGAGGGSGTSATSAAASSATGGEASLYKQPAPPATPRASAIEGEEEPPAAMAMALEMRHWFDTNTLYLVPEFEGVTPHANFGLLLDSLTRAKAMLGVKKAVPMLLGPITFVWLGHLRPETQRGQEQFQQVLASLVPLYQTLLTEIAKLGFHEVQFHEPAMITEHGRDLLLPYFESTYQTLLTHAASLDHKMGVDLVTYFDEMHEDVYQRAIALPFAALSLDFTGHSHGTGGSSGYMTLLENHGFPAKMRLGLGALDGRSAWKPDPPVVLPDMVLLRQAVKHVRLQASCSLQLLPWSVQKEAALKEAHPLVFPLLSFAMEKLADLKDLAVAAMGEDSKVLEEWKWTKLQRDTSYETPTTGGTVATNRTATAVRTRVRALQSSDFVRSLAYKDRQQQQYCFKLGVSFPTTVVGALPGIGKVGDVMDEGEAGKRAKEEIERVVRMQEAAGVEILGHGGYDRGDMVEFIAERLDGMATTEHGWVRVYGSRCVRPPLVVGYIGRPHSFTVEGFKYAQSLTPKVVKGQLPGPTTLLRWSYPAVEIGIKEQTLQLALCLRDEVRDLEIAGAKVIEVDELGFREGLPLRGQKRVDYLAFIGEAFRLATSIAGPHIEIHTHVAYTEVEDCVPAIQDFDADVYLFENTRSHDTTLRALQAGGFQRRLGLGCFDVHCPVIPSVHEILQRLRVYADAFSPEQLVVVPDGPLRTRSWEEVQEALTHMCQAAVMLREEVAESRRLKIPGLGAMNEKGSYGSFSGELVGGGGGGGGREREGSFSSPAGSPR